MRNYLLNPQKMRKIRLLLYDSAVIFGVFVISYLLRITLYEGQAISALVGRVSWLVFLGVLFHLISFYVFGLYEEGYNNDKKFLFINILLSITVASGAVAILSFILPTYKIGRVLVTIHVILMMAAIYLWRLLYNFKHDDTYQKKALIIGWNKASRKVYDLVLLGNSGYEIEGLVIEKGEPRIEGVRNSIAIYDSLDSALMEGKPDAIVFSPVPKHLGKPIRSFLLDLKFEGVEIFNVTGFSERISGRVPVSDIPDGWLLLGGGSSDFQPTIYLQIKRFIDMAVSGLVILLSFPACLLVGLLIKLDSKGPMLFRQERLGQHEKPFMMLKFRTMVENAEKDSGPCWATDSDPRFTRLGKFLRRTRLDEFPQFINVFKGDMSLIGPRPIRAHFADIFAEKFPFYRLRFKVKPGITGWAQVSMRYVNTEEEQYEKLEYEMFYIYHQSIFLDLFIILKTVQAMFKMKGG